jgi:hypothetical protein
MFLGGQVTTASSSTVFDCTEDNPCWITSSPDDQGGFSGGGYLVLKGGSKYLFIENLLVSDKTPSDINNAVTITNTTSVADSSHHISIRNNIIRNIASSAAGAVFTVTARDGGNTHDIVFFGNIFNNVGDPYILKDVDLLCISLGLRYGTQTTSSSYNLWVLNNRWKDTQSNGVQVNGWPGGNPNLHHIYIGKNYGENTRQKSFGVKQCSHVIASQNDAIPGKNPAAGYVSESFGWSYGPDYIWFIFNNVHSGSNGIRPGDSTGSTGSSGSHIFLIGNIFHDIAPNPEAGKYLPDNGWRMGQGINLKQGASTVHVVDNTFYNTNGGVLVNQSDTVLYIHGNIFGSVYPVDTFIDFSLNSTPLSGNINNNLYYDAENDTRWRLNSVDYTTISAWQGTTHHFDTEGIVANPLFADVANKNYAPAAGSPAIGANKNENTEYGYPDVYALFESLYGINIKVDYNGNPRPASGIWSLGAFEYGSLSSAPLPAPPAPSVNLKK